MTRPVLADIVAARDRLEGVSPRHAGALVGNDRRARRPRRHAQGREPPADGILQDQGRIQHDRAADGSGARLRRRHRERGNHGQAVAWAARRAGHRRHDLRSRGSADGQGRRSPRVRRRRSCSAARASTMPSLPPIAHVELTGATFVHAFDDPRVVAGQGTLGLELADQLPTGPGTVVIPIGGGGLAAGVAIGLRALRPELSLIGVQAAACAPFAGRAPTGPTIADGIAVKYPAELTSAILRDLLDEVSSSRTRRSRRQSSCCSSGRSSSSKAPAPHPSRRCSAASFRGTDRSAPCLRAATSTRRR